VHDLSNSARKQLLQFYEHHAPAKVGEVETVLKRYAGREDELFASLVMLYDAGPDLVPLECGL
jgi:hypothetical protein